MALTRDCCFQYDKDSKMKANHNYTAVWLLRG